MNLITESLTEKLLANAPPSTKATTPSTSSPSSNCSRPMHNGLPERDRYFEADKTISTISACADGARTNGQSVT